jgi:heme/copper-type cytochrome/quinol oxidase subunit 1
MLSESMGKLHFWLMLIGFNITFMPMHILGVIGMPRRIYTYSEATGWETLNTLISAGAFIIALSIVVLIVNVARSMRQGEIAGKNPWGASTLEWSISSPPPHYNFEVVPTVRSQHPLWDEEANVVEPPALPAHDHPVMPDPSYWPLVLAFAISMVAGGLIIWQAHEIAGLTVISSSGLLGMRAIYGWVLEPMEEEEHVLVHH